MFEDKISSDDELLACIADDKKRNSAIQYILKQYYGYLESLIVKNNGSATDAEDVIQDALMAFIEIVQKGKFRREASVKSFLYTITYNLWITELRKRGSMEKRNLKFEQQKGLTEDEFGHYIVYKEAQQMLGSFLDKLGDKCKEILLMVYYENLSMKEIVQKFEYQNEQVLRNKKHKCMKELERKLNEAPHIKQELKTALHGL